MSTKTEFTHILDIRITHNSDGNIINNKSLLREVKKNLAQFSYSQRIVWNGKEEEISLSWKKKRWPFPYDKFIGSLVVNSPYNVDSIVQEHTKLTIQDILQNLRDKHSYWCEFDVIFHITKPLSIITPLPGCVGLIATDEA
jgi:hypothetical protein